MPRIFILGFEDLVGEILECIQGEESFSVVGIFSEPPSPWKVLELHPDAGILQALGLRAIEFARQLASFAPPPGLVFLSPWDHPALHESLARLPKARLLLAWNVGHLEEPSATVIPRVSTVKYAGMLPS